MGIAKLLLVLACFLAAAEAHYCRRARCLKIACKFGSYHVPGKCCPRCRKPPRYGPIELRRFRVLSGADDVEQRGNWVQVSSKDLELGRNHRRDQTHVGVRWGHVTIPRKAKILRAVIRFQAEDDKHKKTRLRIGLDRAANSAPWWHKKPSMRRTVGSRIWKIRTPWVTGRHYKSPSVHRQLQRLVNKRRWRKGNAVSAILTRANRRGRRDAYSCEGNGRGPELLVAFRRRRWVYYHKRR